MNPAFSVIFLTTLIGAAQGLFIAVVLGQPYSGATSGRFDIEFGLLGAGVSLGLMFLGLVASFFHLGRPERAWRAVSQWRTSWLSREVIVLPLAMLLVFVYGVLSLPVDWGNDNLRRIIGWSGVITMAALFICTGMIYACIKFLQEWASPWTLINFMLLGCASGVILASALAATIGEPAAAWFTLWGLGLTVAAMFTRLYTFNRNRRIKHRSTIQSAIGIKHRKITQRSMGMTGGSFNTRAFFHHCSTLTMVNMRRIVIVLVFVIPILLLLGYVAFDWLELLWVTFGVQYVGLIAERWLFFAEANHPQNLYYQTVS